MHQLLQLLIVLPLVLVAAVDSLRIADYNSSFTGYPDVMLIGVQKGGTTSLAYFLVNMRKLYVEPWDGKEQHFFSFHFDDANFDRYISGFEWAKQRHGNLPTFEGSTSYFPTQKAWENMRRLYSPECLRQKKFILSLREPTIRDISWYRHFHGKFVKETLKNNNPEGADARGNFHDYVADIRKYDKRPGDYMRSLKQVLEVIHRDQLFILSFEALTGEMEQDTLNRLLYFLGHKPIYVPGRIFPQRNTADDHCGEFCGEADLHEFLCSDLRYLNETYSSVNKDLIDFINSDLNRPVSEPKFLPFTERISEKCIEDDGSVVDFR